MSAQHCTMRVSDWTAPAQEVATINVWPRAHRAAEYPTLHDRTTIGIDTGAASLHLRLTSAEVQLLIRHLQWSQAQQHEAVPA